MCGVAGFWVKNRWRGAFEPTVRRMTEAIRHRGPDDDGYWMEPNVGIALGNRRLAIIDLSPEGHQPMVSESGRYVITFNGEVYNFGELRRELDNTAWRGHSDTEVMLRAIEAWGLEAAVKRFIGMFAFALWDREGHVLHLVRDRLGVKPLYYGWSGNLFLFGSELKALYAHPDFKAVINRDALALLMQHGTIPGPYSIYDGIYKLPPGTILTLRSRVIDKPSPVPFWSARDVAERGVAYQLVGSDAEAVEHLDVLLREAVRLRLVADVPIGAFLSGGVDSSTVVALMQAQSERPVKTFSIGFHEHGYNEAQHAKAVASHLGTDHTELYVTPKEAIAVIPKLPHLYDEPFADPSQIPTFLVAELARRHVTVSLSGDGGDELFAGYNRYFWGQGTWRRIGWMPRTLRRTVARGLIAVSPRAWEWGFRVIEPTLPDKLQQRNPGDKMHKLAEILRADSLEAAYQGIVSHWKDPTSIVVGSSELPPLLTDRARYADLPNYLHQVMYFDLMRYLPDDILAKVDRASMGVSLEAREPLLDHRVVEFAWRVPLSMKIRDGQSKWLLRQVLYKYVPRELVERPKVGFDVPIDAWLRGPLREWAEELLDMKRLLDEGFFEASAIREKWLEHLSGKRNWQYPLWHVLMFQMWLEQRTQPKEILVDQA
jgi:asparagine synthase (glutamine-hydrolysing)